VFNPLLAHLRDFLLFTAPLEALTPELCNAVTGRSDSAELLEYLVRAQLFIVPLNDHGAYYRYHTLFSDYLRSRLMRDYPDRVAHLHQLAASHYLTHKLIDPAVEHLFAANDLAAMERMIRTHARSRLVGGALDTLWQWMERLPLSWIERAARLLVYRAWVLLLRGQIDRVEAPLAQAERVLLDDPDQLLPQDGQILPGEIAALRAQVAHLTGDFNASIYHAQEALHLLPPDNVLTRGLALLKPGLHRLAEWRPACRQSYLQRGHDDDCRG
jgi:LuxR family maltose regulon positive regulatory protein